MDYFYKWLVYDWPHSDWTKSLVCKDAFHWDSTIQKCSRDSALFASQEKLVPCQLFGRRVIPSGRSPVHSSNRPDDVPYRLDARQTKTSSVWTTWIFVRTLICIEKLLFHLAFVRTSQQPFWTTLNDRVASDFFPRSNNGRLLQPSGRCGFPFGRAHP
jgi:hypothetical protein